MPGAPDHDASSNRGFARLERVGAAPLVHGSVIAALCSAARARHPSALLAISHGGPMGGKQVEQDGAP
jgi:hypothetical protein